MARFPYVDENNDRRWREIDVDLPVSLEPTGSGELQVSVVTGSGPPGEPEPVYSAFAYELWADADPHLFSDGFESGTLAAWGETLP